MKIDIPNLFLVFLLAFLAAGCGKESEIPARTDTEMAACIIGTWVLDDGPLSLYYMEKTYAPDGTSAGLLLNRQTGKRIAFTGRWKIKNGYFSGEVITSTDTKALPLRAAYWDKIVEITNSKWVMIEQGTGRVTFKHRKGHFALF
jgi:hypothetical protein